jgi:small subunit ribosomal protein S3
VGQKVHPYGFRIGFNKTWKSRWFASKDYANLLHEDLALKKDLKKRFQHAGVAMIEIERAARNLKINIHTSRPGIIIGRKGQEVDKLKQEIQKRTNREVFINIQEIQKPELPLQTLRADIDYGFAEANTTYGQIGVKVWLYKGERLVPRVGRDEEYRDRAPRRPAGRT